MNMNDYSKDNIFFAEEIIFDYPGKKISQNEIDEIDDFPGKDDFIRFYTAHNGGSFVYGAWFYPEDCYNVSIGSDSYITMDFFLSIPIDDIKKVDIESWKDVIAQKQENYEDFMLFHIPFALDVVENTFWIDIQTGEIKFTDFEVCLNPDEDAITVASSFKNFCKCIRRRDMK